ncbi:hypothetical protein CLU97_3880 [Chryseobacterium sp. 7]|nr:hypothetical protein CLU97_3880 [Chryseobacterium sp. 7]
MDFFVTVPPNVLFFLCVYYKLFNFNSVLFSDIQKYV